MDGLFYFCLACFSSKMLAIRQRQHFKKLIVHQNEKNLKYFKFLAR